jgi:MFS family permease
VIAYFALLGMAEGVWVVHIPVAQARLRLSDGPLGAALLAGPAAVVMMMPVAGRLADRFGSARIARTACIVVAFLPAVLDSAGTLSMLLVGLLAFGAVGGLLAVSMNAQAVLRRGAQLGDHGRDMMIVACRSPDSERPHKIMGRCLSDHGLVRP